jgi:cardiolipin synthase
MSAFFAAMVGWSTLAHILLYAGLALSLTAAVVYTRDAVAATRAAPSS